MSNYSTDVLAQPDLVGYWRCTDASGTTITDSAATPHDGTKGTGVTLGSTPLVTGSADTSALFDGTSNAYVDLGASAEGFFHNWTVSTPFTIEAILDLNLPRSAYLECDVWGKQDPSAGANYRGLACQVAYNLVASKTVIAIWLIDNYGANSYIRVGGSTDLANGVEHHLTWAYDGSGLGAGIKFWVNGFLESGLTITGNAISTLVTSIHPYIGSRGGGANFFKGNIQELAVFNTCHTSPAHWLGDHAPLRRKSLSLGRTPPALPAQKPLVIFDNDVATDIDNVGNLMYYAVLHRANQVELLGVSVCDSGTASASCFRAILDWLCPEVPLWAYQGSDMPTGSTWAGDVQTRFRPQDSTNKGCTAATVSAGGSGYAAGDKLTVAGGTLATGVVGVPTILQVASLSSGAVASVSILQSGSYSAVPSNPASVTGGSGTGATFTLTMTALRGNFSDPLQQMRAVLTNAPRPVCLAGGGFSKNFARLLASPANNGGDGYPSGHDIIVGHVQGLYLNQGWTPNTTVSYISRASNPDFNLAGLGNANVLADAVAIYGTNWPGPLIMEGEDNTNISVTAGREFVDGQPPDWADPTTNPVKYAFDRWVAGGGALPRPAWGLSLLKAIATGFVTSSDPAGFPAWLAWGALNGTMTVNSAANTPIAGVAAGGNGFTDLTAGNASMLRRIAADADATAFADSMLAFLPTAKLRPMDGGFSAARTAGGMR